MRGLMVGQEEPGKISIAGGIGLIARFLRKKNPSSPALHENRGLGVHCVLTLIIWELVCVQGWQVPA